MMSSSNQFNLNKTRSTYDRFITRRAPIASPVEHLFEANPDEIYQTYNADSDSNITFFINIKRAEENKHGFSKLLKSVLLPTLRFYGHPSSGAVEAPKATWPVIARAESILKNPIHVLDFPLANGAMITPCGDWGGTSMLVSIYNSQLYMWNIKDSKHRSVDLPGFNRTSNQNVCIRYNIDYSMIAIGIEGICCLYVNAEKSIVMIESCYRLNSNLTAIEWYNNGFVTGCDKGILQKHKMSGTGNNIKFQTEHELHLDGVIVSIKISCYKSQLAVITKKKAAIYIFHLSTFNIIHKLNWVVENVDWHPWRNNLLVLIRKQLRINKYKVILWDIGSNKQTIIQETELGVSAISFCPKTAELVVAYNGYDSSNISETASLKAYTQVDVFKNSSHKVESFLLKCDSIVYMLWGNNGTVMGAATLDEDLHIWQFLSSSLKTNLKEYHKDNFNVFAHQIR